jgi:hypothetical protein
LSCEPAYRDRARAPTTPTTYNGGTAEDAEDAENTIVILRSESDEGSIVRAKWLAINHAEQILRCAQDDSIAFLCVLRVLGA